MEHSQEPPEETLLPQHNAADDMVEDLPFAVYVRELSSRTEPSRAEKRPSATQKMGASLTLNAASMTSESSARQPPGLASSVISSTDSASSLLQTDSDYLDAAASLLPLNSSLNFHKSWTNLEKSQEPQTVPESSSEGFLTVLLSQADDRAVPVSPPTSPARLPVLHEETSVSSNVADSLIVEEGEEPPRIPEWSYRGARSPKESKLASLAGATATTTGDNEFAVSVNLQSSVADVMEIIGNPDLLKLWYDAVPHLIIVRSSEGARNAVERAPSGCDRAYEGEWIEASVPAGFLSPSGSRIYRINSLLGCPVFGKLSMFVERLSGQVSLTLGPFPGNTEIVHKIQVCQVDSSKVQIVDKVKIRKIADGEDCCNCGVVDVLQRCFLPSTEAYMDQVLSSMARLRFLIENGEQHSQYIPPSLPSHQTEASSPLLVQA